MEYEISIRITFLEKISKALKLEKDRFVAAFGSGYKSEPHITLYLGSYTQDGFPQLLHDLRELRVKPFTISLLEPKVILEEGRHRNLYVVDISNKEELRQLHEKVSEIAIPYRSPLLREKTRQRFEQQGIHTDGTRANLNMHEGTRAAEVFDPHITLGEIDLDKTQADIADVRKNLKQIEGEEIAISSIAIFFYGKESGEEKAKLIDEVAISFQS